MSVEGSVVSGMSHIQVMKMENSKEREGRGGLFSFDASWLRNNKSQLIVKNTHYKKQEFD